MSDHIAMRQVTCLEVIGCTYMYIILTVHGRSLIPSYINFIVSLYLISNSLQTIYILIALGYKLILAALIDSEQMLLSIEAQLCTCREGKTFRPLRH